MGTTLSSCSHFVAFELLHSRRQATVIMVGCTFIFFVLAHSVDAVFNPSLSGAAFYSITFRLFLRFPLRSTFQNGVLLEYRLELHLRSVLLLYGTLPAFQLSCPPEYCTKLTSHFYPLLTQPSNERLAFFGLTERFRFLFSSNL